MHRFLTAFDATRLVTRAANVGKHEIGSRATVISGSYYPEARDHM
ncbi:hypothetical protein AB0O47_05805 [Streptomyces noursei]